MSAEIGELLSGVQKTHQNWCQKEDLLAWTWLMEMWFGKRKDERVRDEETLIPG